MYTTSEDRNENDSDFMIYKLKVKLPPTRWNVDRLPKETEMHMVAQWVVRPDADWYPSHDEVLCLVIKQSVCIEIARPAMPIKSCVQVQIDEGGVKFVVKSRHGKTRGNKKVEEFD
jgi:hypothetical protein